MKTVLVWCALMSVLAFILYGVDKRKAVKEKWRIPERTLLVVSWFGGAFGAFLGMRVFHHKTKHAAFRIQVPIGCVLWCIIAVMLGKRGY